MLKIRPSLTPKSKSLIMLWDAFVFLAISALVYYLRIGAIDSAVLETRGLWFVTFLTLSGLYIFGCYDLDRDLKPWTILFRQAIAVVISFISVILINYLLSKDRTGLFGRGVLLGSLSGFYIVSAVYRLALMKSYQQIRANADWLFVVNDKIHQQLLQDLKKNSFAGKITILAQSQWKELQIQLEKVWHSLVIATTSQELNQELGPTLMQARFSGQFVQDLSLFYENTWRKVPIYYLEHDWFVLSEGFGLVHNPVGLRIKRLADVFLSSLLLLVTWPFMLLTAIAVKLESKGPAVYSQVRTGVDGEDFVIYKFRSMRTDAEKDGAKWASTNDSRITRVGKFIRLTRLDELPQLWNVFRGDMSFIGPRPERPEFNKELEKQIPFYNLRHLVRPGITGWAQVLYPYGASVEDSKEKLQYDLFYIKNYSLFLDFIIVLKTISVVVLGRGR
ncbi:MAG: exopolysaccharide biosynthesis polyprenyl glycosylphosphotransferase [Bdellovibrionales bacterium]|nr:exopolysaccharide biosynthesis polyprenyl glycosylphosphotransferase [Bdellovibrionales bacterium]